MNHPELELEDKLHAQNADFFDAIASDILLTLKCHTLLDNKDPVFQNGAYVYGAQRDYAEPEQRRRLDEEDDPNLDHNEGEYIPDEPDDDYDFQNNGATSGMITAAHLFCLAAFPTQVPEDMDETLWWHDKVQCKVRTEKQNTILNLWSTARAEINEEDVLLKTLHVATEQPIDLFGKRLQVWAAPNDEGTEYLVNTFDAQYREMLEAAANSNNEQNNNEEDVYQGIAGLNANLGPGKLFVDVGSGLGYTSLAIAILYPGTEIVSIEAASTNWLLQELNWRCNDFDDGPSETPQVVLAGVGPSTGTSQAAQFVWRPTATTNTRAWSLNLDNNNNEEEDPSKSANDIELAVKLRPWHMVQAEAEIVGREIAVLNVDCEGCEYNLVPALSETEFQSISSVLGQMHWSYINPMNLPSSERAKNTHSRLCEHENFSRTSIECCAFPDLPVRSSYSGEVLVMEEEGGAPKFPEQPVTVQYLAGDLCDTFDDWAERYHLFSVESDWGWFQGGTMRQHP